MTHQYRAVRFRRHANGRWVGTIPVGTIVYIQDNVSPLGGLRHVPVCREPWIVEAWLNRDYQKLTKGGWVTAQMVGGHLAQVRSLRTGRRQKIADWILRYCVDAGLEVFHASHAEQIDSLCAMLPKRQTSPSDVGLEVPHA